ncbi:preprotein translocase subunit SecE [Vagococcus fluvialis]|uniref:Protein translocase subunit SecE n=1 Tax=Vagococcus fluvialis TaxID=2738 RepID=A0A7X6D6H2_9ENTE|nr:preprotein translocase subunit SecE [Vagococcus fluvialis]MDG0043217.1 preprotein translocase subunit SecE [Salmonella enterica subsp. enterica]MDT2746377.1 preprotein translocase subunit SecE [Vagococcus fluvialis]MDT2781241.1 preprotein translocase subunit SecE [Vagococcus fluvialis]NKC66736.1 preprotein translocase subunit SecE [Vagococcus fluvialis]UDM70838.1 preprotein translocase subunit SecE [Vagococcus fluvialis]
MKFLKGVAEEMKIVTWPTKSKLTKDVITVIQSTLLFAAFFWVADFVIDVIMKSFI